MQCKVMSCMYVCTYACVSVCMVDVCMYVCMYVPGGESTTKSMTRQLGFESRGVTTTLGCKAV